MPGVEGAGAGVVGVVVSLFEGAAGAAGASGEGDAGALLASFELSLQAASPKNDTAATEVIKNFFMMALLP
ncbi:hypothetical protein J3U99_02755 [Brucella pituitosa]|uniref:Uncharacterized protein n=1 Tax=Brucella pituitosa TaxID=571256 RepID=A0ABS3JYL6_9HYPH|nr:MULTISPECIES: hypothetical protein [Brucella]MBO1039717.1 hypothetical protein [Brucella pituitosa]MCK4203677.1 hypothetical protein [Brucella pituitosa]TCQ80903.1 hypothetical protein EDF68_102189 [Ochrobactrum sp. BH3]